MTETELRQRYESDANADPDKAGLSTEEVTALLKDWFYTGTAFDSSLANPLTSRYCRAVAAGYRKRQGKAADPNKYLRQNTGTEVSATLFNNFVQAERGWLDEAARFDDEARAAESGARTGASTSTVRNVPTW